MLSAAYAHGSPTMVIAIIRAAISQPAAIHRPPQTIHSTFRSNARGDMQSLRVVMARRNRREAIWRPMKMGMLIDIRQRRDGQPFRHGSGEQAGVRSEHAMDYREIRYALAVAK